MSDPNSGRLDGGRRPYLLRRASGNTSQPPSDGVSDTSSDAGQSVYYRNGYFDLFGPLISYDSYPKFLECIGIIYFQKKTHLRRPDAGPVGDSSTTTFDDTTSGGGSDSDADSGSYIRRPFSSIRGRGFIGRRSLPPQEPLASSPPRSPAPPARQEFTNDRFRQRLQDLQADRLRRQPLQQQQQQQRQPDHPQHQQLRHQQQLPQLKQQQRPQQQQQQPPQAIVVFVDHFVGLVRGSRVERWTTHREISTRAIMG